MEMLAAAGLSLCTLIAPDLDKHTRSAKDPVHPTGRTFISADGIPTTPRKQLTPPIAAILNLRCKKATRIVLTYADYRDEDGNPSKSSFLPYVRDLVEYCYEVEQRGMSNGEDAEGFGATYIEALTYGFSNFSLTCYSIAYYPPRLGDDCCGPFDVKQEPHVIDPVENMKHHVDEQYEGWLKGYRGVGLCRYVMYPASPRDWDYKNGVGRFQRNYNRFIRCIEEGYRVGKLP